MSFSVPYAPRSPPHACQMKALEQGWNKAGFAYLLEMGLGKSRVAIDDFCINFLAGTVEALLVVASKSVYTNWTRVDDEVPGEFQLWLWDGVRESARTCTWRSGAAFRAERDAVMSRSPPGARILAVNVEALSRMGDAFDLCMEYVRTFKTMVVVDESPVIKTHDSHRTKAILRIGSRAAARRILTGSPVTRNPTDLFSQFEFVKPGCLGHRSFYTFRARYCVLKEISVGGRMIKTVVGVQTQHMSELADSVARHSFRARKSEYLDLPAKVFQQRAVELSREQSRMYSEMRASAVAEIDLATVTGRMTTEIVVTQLMRMHQIICGHAKLDDGTVLRLPENRTAILMEIAEETDDQIVVWCTYRSDLETVARALREKYGPDSVAEWWGGVSMPEREIGEKEFKLGRRRFMVSNQASGGRGRTWTSCATVVYYSNSHALDDREQSEDRVHRYGQTRMVTYVDLVASGTLDEKIMRALREKKDVARSILLDGPSAWL